MTVRHRGESLNPIWLDWPSRLISEKLTVVVRKLPTARNIAL